MKQRAKAAGATGWITKPFEAENLVKIVKKVLGK
jgi:two-component system chemotaxis response regulator CheY